MRRFAKYLVPALLLITLIVMLIFVGRLLAGSISLLGTGDSGERDPQFAEPAIQVTRPPDLDDEGGYPGGTDQSAGWDIQEQTPVDYTAEDLAAMEENR